MSAAARYSGPWSSPPPGRWNLVPNSDVRDQLRRAFADWGRPLQLRVDNGSPWGSVGEWPTELAMWAIGLGVGMIWNTPRCPQENGVIERSQGTADRWCEPWTCETAEELQGRLERMDRLYREEYPYHGGRSRLESYPGLVHSGRAYTAETECELWDWDRVASHLTRYIVTRHVNGRGMVSLYNRGHYIGRAHQGKDVQVTFDPVRVEWVFSDSRGTELRHLPAPELRAERILALDVTDRRKGSFVQDSDQTDVGIS